MTTQYPAEEHANIETMLALMGEEVASPEMVARRLLRKFGGDLQKAAGAFLEGDRGESSAVSVGPALPPRHTTPVRSNEVKPYGASLATKPAITLNSASNSVIDLTGGDDDTDELQRALKASLETSNPQHSQNQGQIETGTKFGPSQRPSDGSWAMVSSNAKIDTTSTAGVSKDDEAMDRAIQESLQASLHAADDVADGHVDDRPIEDFIRKAGWPVALSTNYAKYSHAVLVIQALFFVPQIRMYISCFRPSSAPPGDERESIVWWLSETYTNMDAGILSVLFPENVLRDLEPEASAWNSPAESAALPSLALYRKLTRVIEQVSHEHWIATRKPGVRPRLFYFLHGNANITMETRTEIGDEMAVVNVPVHPNHLYNESHGEQHNDLVSALFDSTANWGNETHQDVIWEPSDVIAFTLDRSNNFSYKPASSGNTKNGKDGGFRYPKTLYLDRFLLENGAITQKKIILQQEMLKEVENLAARKKSLTSFDNKDILKDLRASVYYYENVADGGHDVVRKDDIERIGGKLKSVLQSIEKELADIDAKITQLKTDASALFDTPDLQKYRYDLRVVLIHDGIYGRKHVYSYVEDGGKWWRSLDRDVTEVSEETVLADTTGVHMGAGPYLILYSRSVSPEYLDGFAKLPWPQSLKNATKFNNMTFLEQIDPALAATVMDPNSPPQSPIIRPDVDDDFQRHMELA